MTPNGRATAPNGGVVEPYGCTLVPRNSDSPEPILAGGSTGNLTAKHEGAAVEKPTATHPPKVTVRRRIDADHGPVWRVECPRCHWWTNRATHWTAISMAHGHRCAPPWPPVPKRQRSGRGWW